MIDYARVTAYARLIIAKRRIIEPLQGSRLPVVPKKYRDAVIQRLDEEGYDKWGELKYYYN